MVQVEVRELEYMDIRHEVKCDFFRCPCLYEVTVRVESSRYFARRVALPPV